MMTKYVDARIVGVMPFDFTARDGKHLVGTKVYFTFHNGSTSLEGFACDSTTLPLDGVKSLPFPLTVGNSYRLACMPGNNGRKSYVFCSALPSAKS